MRKVLLSLALCCSVFEGLAADLKAQRRLLEQSYAAQKRACESEFAVNDCLRQSAEKYRSSSLQLRTQELAIDRQARADVAQRKRDLIAARAGSGNPQALADDEPARAKPPPVPQLEPARKREAQPPKLRARRDDAASAARPPRPHEATKRAAARARFAKKQRDHAQKAAERERAAAKALRDGKPRGKPLPGPRVSGSR